jgi:phosphatidylinositol alpha-1,6-mannosyltransferase
MSTVAEATQTSMSALRRHLQGRGLLLAFAAASLLWALIAAHDTAHPSHHVWGELATGAYALSALAALIANRRWASRVVTVVNLVGAVLVPLVVLAADNNFQSEVGVVQRSASYVLSAGRVYLPHPVGRFDYNPYLPGMSVFGMPHQLLTRRPTRGFSHTVLNVIGDPRFWFAAVFLVSLLISWRLLRRHHASADPEAAGTGTPGSARGRLAELHAPLALIGWPVVALPLCVSGVDLPIVGLTCLTLAIAATGRGALAGVAAAAAGALKWTAWPLLPVAVVLVASRRGARQAVICLVSGLVGLAVSIVPFAVFDADDLLRQVFGFPLGLGSVRTPASSPLPGHLLWDRGTAGHIADLVLLGAGLAAVCWWTIRRRPRTAIAAANRLALGMAIVFTFAPSSRFGYFVLPLVVWLLPQLAAGQLRLPRLPLPGRASLAWRVPVRE